MSEGIDPLGDRPVYRQIADRLRQAIVHGNLAPGARLPSESELIERYSASRGTVRQSIAVLRSEGLIDVVHGRGAFVRERTPIRRLSYDRFARRHREAGQAAFLAELEAEGRKAEVQVLRVGQGEPDSDIRERLQLSDDKPVLMRHRRYLADRQPVEVATSWLPLELVEGTAIVEANPGPGGIYARLEDMGHHLEHFTEEVSARMPQPDEARALQLGPGVPVIRLIRVAYTVNDRPVEVCDTIIAADRYVLSYELPGR